MNTNLQNHAFSVQYDNLVNKEKKKDKKVQKALENFSYIKLEPINKIYFYKNKKSKFIINNPDVLKSTVNSSFLIFGETKIENNYSNSENK